MNIGIDLVDVDRFLHFLNNPQFKNRVASQESMLSLAGRHAAKEALIKAVSELDFSSYTLVDVLVDASGAPYFYFDPLLHSVKRKYEISLSISHDNKYAVAVVLAKSKRFYKLYRRFRFFNSR